MDQPDIGSHAFCGLCPVGRTGGRSYLKIEPLTICTQAAVAGAIDEEGKSILPARREKGIRKNKHKPINLVTTGWHGLKLAGACAVHDNVVLVGYNSVKCTQGSLAKG